MQLDWQEIEIEVEIIRLTMSQKYLFVFSLAGSRFCKWMTQFDVGQISITQDLSHPHPTALLSEGWGKGHC